MVSDALVLTAEPQVVPVPPGDCPGLHSTGFSLQVEERDELVAIQHHKGHLEVGPNHSEKATFVSWQGTLYGDFLATKQEEVQVLNQIRGRHQKVISKVLLEAKLMVTVIIVNFSQQFSLVIRQLHLEVLNG